MRQGIITIQVFTEMNEHSLRKMIFMFHQRARILKFFFLEMKQIEVCVADDRRHKEENLNLFYFNSISFFKLEVKSLRGFKSFMMKFSFNLDEK